MPLRRMLVGGLEAIEAVPSTPPTPPPADLYAMMNGSDGLGTSYAFAAATQYLGAGAWTNHGSVLTPTSGWESTIIGRPWLMHDGTQFVLYYDGYNGALWAGIGRATAPTWPPTWTRYGSNPVISPGTFDAAGVTFPVVLYEPSDGSKPWKMWYASGDGATGETDIAYAYSTNGTSWTKVGEVLARGSAGAWDDVGLSAGAIIKDGATYYLFYAGAQGPTNRRWQGGYATFTDPEGTYTKYAGNPVMLARFNDAGTSQSITTGTAGTAILTCASTANWNVGEPLAVIDADSHGEIHKIQSIDSGTQVTFTDNLTSTFTAAQSGVVRSFAYNAVYPRTVRATATGFEAYVTAFQPVEDLAFGTWHPEGSMRMTATSLSGPWSYDYTTGLMFPINLPGSLFSDDIENPSVIAAP